MMRDLSTAARGGIFQEHTGEIFLALLTIVEDSLSEPIRIVNDTIAVTSNGETYTPFPFDAILPMDDGKSLPSLGLVIDNVSMEMIAILRALTTPPIVTLQVVLASSPDTVEMEVANLAVREINADALQITFTVVNDDWLSGGYPAHKYNITTHRGLYR